MRYPQDLLLGRLRVEVFLRGRDSAYQSVSGTRSAAATYLVDIVGQERRHRDQLCRRRRSDSQEQHDEQRRRARFTEQGCRGRGRRETSRDIGRREITHIRVTAECNSREAKGRREHEWNGKPSKPTEQVRLHAGRWTTSDSTLPVLVARKTKNQHYQ